MRKSLTGSLGVIVGCLVVVVGGCGGATSSGSGPAPSAGAPAPSSAAALVWPAPPDPMERTIAAGLEPAPKEFGINHAHAHLDVFVDGRPVVVPAGIGIEIDDPQVRTFTEPDGSVSYGGIELCADACISPLHTHFATGILHTESATADPVTLGQFFTEWGVELSESCVGEHCSPETTVAFYVNGEPYTGDPRAIELSDRRQIAIVVGTPPAEIPATADFSKE